jgi:4,5-dihydroxyphthalate decarboxylase
MAKAPAARVALTIALSDYDHVRDFVNGVVSADGIDANFLTYAVEEIFFRFTKFREWDVSEMSMGKYASLISQGDTSLTAIPVFPSRIFRHSSIYVRRDGPIGSPADLTGRRVGIPEWAQTAAVYSRGVLMHEYGIKLQDIEWHQAGVNEPGRTEKVELKLPAGVRLRPRRDRSLNGMLLSGEVDAVMTAHPPQAFEDGHPDIARLFVDYREAEESYWRKTGIFPIMHTIAIRRDVYERNRWIAMNLYKAFEHAKRRSVARVLDVTAPRVPIPWCFAYAADARATFGDDFWPYGVEPNRTTLEAYLRYAHEQGVCHRPVKPEELFAPETAASFRV